jgi:hypothetical protein
MSYDEEMFITCAAAVKDTANLLTQARRYGDVSGIPGQVADDYAGRLNALGDMIIEALEDSRRPIMGTVRKSGLILPAIAIAACMLLAGCSNLCRFKDTYDVRDLVRVPISTPTPATLPVAPARVVTQVEK